MIDFLAPPRAGLFFAFSTSKKPPQNVMANLVFIANFADLRMVFFLSYPNNFEPYSVDN